MDAITRTPQGGAKQVSECGCDILGMIAIGGVIFLIISTNILVLLIAAQEIKKMLAGWK